MSKRSWLVTCQLKEALESFINENGVVLAICGGFQLLGQYYIEASGRRIEGLGIMGHYTLNQTKTAILVTSRFITKNSMRPTTALKITKDGLFLSDDEKPLGKVVYGNGNNQEDGCEGVHYKNVFGSYFHGPILSRNANLAYRLVTTALKNKYGSDIELAAYEGNPGPRNPRRIRRYQEQG